MTARTNYRKLRQFDWHIPTGRTAARIFGIVSITAWMLLLCTTPPDAVQRACGVTALLFGWLRHEALAVRAVTRVTGHVTETVADGVEKLADVVEDSLDVSEHLADRHIAHHGAPVAVHPFMVPVAGRRTATHYFDVVTQSFRPVAEVDETLAAVVPLRSSAC